MKIKDIIQKVDKSKNFEKEVYLGDFANKIFAVSIYCNEQTRLKSYFIGNWRCTDTTVGYLVYFLDDKPVAISYKTARKQTERIEWLSKDDYINVKTYVMSFLVEEEDIYYVADLEEDIGETYQISFYEQLLDYHMNNAIFEGNNVKIIGFKDSYNDDDYHPETVQIQFENGDTVWIETEKIDFRYNLTK